MAADLKDWVGRGAFEFLETEQSFQISSSDVGYILPRTLGWDDYSFEFNFKIVNKCVGWIMRAENLSNYVMMQCCLDRINPHVRINGQWIVLKHGTDSINLSFKNNLSLDKWYYAKVQCNKRTIKQIIYEDGRVIFERLWTIPEDVLVDYSTSTNQANQDKVTLLQNIDLDYGAVGFRNHGEEKALVKNVFIEKFRP